MRTTLSLDDDVAAQLRKYQQDRKLSFKSALNEALRVGLAQARHGPTGRRKRYRVRPVNLGRCLLPSLDNIADVLALVEGEDHK